MNETMVTVVGNVATPPVFQEFASGASTRFRVAARARHWSREKNQWVDGHTNFFTVWSWRQLATNAAASLTVGDPVVIQGRLKVRNEQRGEQNWLSADIEAVTIGHDLARGTSAFRRANKAESAQSADSRPEPDFETAPQPEAAAALVT
ncbi:single-stranded DNA-binding protein [Streptomyces cavernae]|uniref:single-stranded DNA-binding protein n=1 Tax=Streptomyces cavernae TaxID=2259034 RepID=UPI000FEBC4B4|nr:single-stranded DNA-binding protein [Streptomyces cavernae]